MNDIETDKDANKIISEANRTNADSLFLAPNIQKIDKAILIARANKNNGNRLSLFGSPTLYTEKTVSHGQAFVEGLVLAVPWFDTLKQDQNYNSFASKAKSLWGRGRVNWRTATTYDATQAIITGLRQSNDPQELYKTLKNPHFHVNNGAYGSFEFSDSGVSTDNSKFLIEVKHLSNPDRYDFEEK